MMRFLTLAFLALAGLAALPGTASANSKQCVKNDSGTSLSVHFYGQNGEAYAKNTNLTYGFSVCHTVSDGKSAYATVACNGCGWAEAAAKTAAIVAGTGAFGVCVLASDGECAAEWELFASGTAAAVESIPPSFKGKLVVVPGYNSTTHITGNAFGLHVK